MREMHITCDKPSLKNYFLEYRPGLEIEPGSITPSKLKSYKGFFKSLLQPPLDLRVIMDHEIY